MDKLLGLLKKNLRGEVSVSQSDIERTSRDASLFKVIPKAVVFPKDKEDLKFLVRSVADVNLKGGNVNLTARAAGSDMSGGPLGESIIVEFPRHFNKIKNIGREDGVGIATIESGVYYRDFEKETLKKNLILPCYPASREICTLGGMVANDAGGEKSLQYGKTGDYIIELKTVLQDGNEYIFRALTMDELETKKNQTTFEGEVYRRMFYLLDGHYDAIKRARPNVPKNSSGYFLWDVYDKEKGMFDLSKLLIGSQGTLGLVTEIKLKLEEPATHSRLVIAYVRDINKLGEITNKILETKPESLESFDNHTFKLAKKIFPYLLRKMKFNFFKLAWSFLPEFFAIITGRIPKVVLLAEYTAEDETTAQNKADLAYKVLEKIGVKSKIVASNIDRNKYWTMRRESFNLLRKKVSNLKTAPFIDDIVINPEKLGEFLPKLYSILDEHNITYTIAGHAGSGNFHIIPLMDLKNEDTIKTINIVMKKVVELVKEYRGSLSGEHNDGLVRTPFLEEMFGEKIVKLFEETKKIFDPQNIFNPGKKVSVSSNQNDSWHFALDHISRQ